MRVNLSVDASEISFNVDYQMKACNSGHGKQSFQGTLHLLPNHFLTAIVKGYNYCSPVLNISALNIDTS